MKKRIFGLLILASVLSGLDNANAASKNENDKKVATVEGNDEAVVKYLGETSDNGIVFDVNFANTTGKNFDLLITNAQGDVLFNRSFKGSNFDRKVMIKKDPDVNGVVRFTVKSKGGASYSKNFQMNTKSEVVRNIVVQAIN